MERASKKRDEFLSPIKKGLEIYGFEIQLEVRSLFFVRKIENNKRCLQMIAQMRSIMNQNSERMEQIDKEMNRLKEMEALKEAAKK